MSAVTRPILLLTLCYVAFIFLGLPDALLSIAWPTMSREFGWSIESLGLLMVGGTLGYMGSSFMAGSAMDRFGIAGLLIGSSILTSVSLILFMLTPVAWTLPLCAFIAGLGGGGIDAGLNAYVDEHYSERVMQWLHASFGIGVTVGPLIMTASLVHLGLWRPGYLFVLILVLLMLAAFIFYRGLWEPPAHKKAEGESPVRPTLGLTLKQAGTWLGTLSFFFYVGAEMTAGLWAFTLLTEGRGVDTVQAGFWVSVYWGTFTLGRVAAGILAGRFSAGQLTMAGVLLSLIGAVLFALGIPGPGGAYALAIMGFAYAPIFPALISTTDKRVDKPFVSRVVGMQVAFAGMAMLILPPLAGLIASQLDFEAIPLFVLLLTVILAVVAALALRLQVSRSQSAEA